MARKLRIGVIGFGRMGRGFVSVLQQDNRWQIDWICDAQPSARELAARTVPTAKITADLSDVLSDGSLDVVGLFTLADARPQMIRQALKRKLHIIAEKPIAADSRTEWKLVEEIEASGLLVAVNLFNRNAWYHKEMQAFIAEGEIGELAIVRVCHMTPGHMPGEGHEPEGPPFHDCGMHYVDVARWYAKSDYATWHAQGVRMWSHTDPWWVQAHGTFKNGIAFDVTQGFVYGHLAKDKTHNCYFEAIGTRGICRMRHDFKTATIECHGVNTTLTKTAMFNDKKLDVMCDIFAKSIHAKRNMGFPTARDSAIASEVAWAMLEDAIKNNSPAIGTPRELKMILEHRRSLRDGFGLPVRPQDTPTTPAPIGQAPIACGEDLCALAEHHRPPRTSASLEDQARHQ
jgi:myo-inositol 2-dehydrogenase/D-chiro-inositol 1-dehydrogenase